MLGLWKLGTPGMLIFIVPVKTAIFRGKNAHFQTPQIGLDSLGGHRNWCSREQPAETTLTVTMTIIYDCDFEYDYDYNYDYDFDYEYQYELWLNDYMTIYETSHWKLSQCGSVSFLRDFCSHGFHLSLPGWCDAMLSHSLDVSICILKSLPFHSNPFSHIRDTYEELVYWQWTMEGGFLPI